MLMHRLSQNNIEPRFEFGFGLSYTNFTYSNLKVSTLHDSDNTFASLESAWAAGDATPVGEGSSTALWLHRPAFEVSFTVKNTGGVTGGEVSRLHSLACLSNTAPHRSHSSTSTSPPARASLPAFSVASRTCSCARIRAIR